jgi:hypothetical protein
MPRGTRDQENHNHGRGAGKNKRGEAPTATGRNFIGEPGADARQERGRNVGVGCGAQALVDRRKERFFLGECGPAGRAGSEVRAQFALRRGAGGNRLD